MHINFHRKPTQHRAHSAIDNILESAFLLAQQGDLSAMTARELSKRSGYSIGSIYYHFKKVNNIYSLLFERMREKRMEELAQAILELDPKQGVEAAMRLLVGNVFAIFNRPKRSVLVYFARLYLRNAEKPETFSAMIDTLVDPLMVVASRDQTNTFRRMSQFEVRMMLKAIQAVIRNPFLENDPLAGSEEHQHMATVLAIKLFQEVLPT